MIHSAVPQVKEAVGEVGEVVLAYQPFSMQPTCPQVFQSRYQLQVVPVVLVEAKLLVQPDLTVEILYSAHSYLPVVAGVGVQGKAVLILLVVAGVDRLDKEAVALLTQVDPVVYPEQPIRQQLLVGKGRLGGKVPVARLNTEGLEVVGLTSREQLLVVDLRCMEPVAGVVAEMSAPEPPAPLVMLVERVILTPLAAAALPDLPLVETAAMDQLAARDSCVEAVVVVVVVIPVQPQVEPEAMVGIRVVAAAAVVRVPVDPEDWVEPEGVDAAQ